MTRPCIWSVAGMIDVLVTYNKPWSAPFTRMFSAAACWFWTTHADRLPGQRYEASLVSLRELISARKTSRSTRTKKLEVQELCGLSVLMSLTVSVIVNQHWTVLRHWSQFVPNNYVNRHHHHYGNYHLARVWILTKCINSTRGTSSRKVPGEIKRS